MKVKVKCESESEGWSGEAALQGFSSDRIWFERIIKQIIKSNLKSKGWSVEAVLLGFSTDKI